MATLGKPSYVCVRVCVAVWVGVGVDVGFGIEKVCGDRTEVVYRYLCVDCMDHNGRGG